MMKFNFIFSKETVTYNSIIFNQHTNRIFFGVFLLLLLAGRYLGGFYIYFCSLIGITENLSFW